MSLPDSSGDFSLDAYRWKNRLLLVFAASAKHPAYEQQMQRFAGTEAAFADRDLLLLHVLHEGTSVAGTQRLDKDTAGQLRRRYGIAPDEFALVLVGKDGTEKRRDTAPVPPSAIFDVIDAMPMRQREMRSQRTNDPGSS